ncbi:MAG: hypothetical protein PHG66_06640 [Candidatus Colwellbacteria bacterium]|nr:hypothetical protein [Candidatus Colwellbacteria bacterium]
MKRYIEYLKNNPENLWFKRKVYGWGWVPVRWQGWISIGLYVAFISFIGFRAEKSLFSESGLFWGFHVPLIIATAALIIVACLKGEKPRWQWGLKDKDRSNGREE